MTWMMALATPALAYHVEAIACCHLDPTEQRAAAPRRIAIAPFTDSRTQARGGTPEDLAWMGVVRGGWGNPFQLHGEQALGELLGQALEQQLDALGHDARLVPDAAAVSASDTDLVLVPAVSRWGVDISSWGSRKLTVDLVITATAPGDATPLWTASVHLADQDTSNTALRPVADLRQRAREWYGKGGGAMLWTAAVEDGIAATMAALIAPGGEGAAHLIAPSTTPAPTPGCTKDTDCKGDRVCEQGTCRDP
ncbi:MAG: hypothetical protein KC621_21365 [Myxococcales bacterium]|nr:hypothetical protein [Myxococcales bacterium]